MKNIIHSFFVLCAFLLTGCGLMDLSDRGYPVEEGVLKASEVKATLLAAPGGCWEGMVEGHKFFFQFMEDGTVSTNSEYMEPATSGDMQIYATGKLVQLNVGSVTHLAYMENGFDDTRFTIAQLPEDGSVTLTGMTSGKTLTLVPSSPEALAALVEEKGVFIELLGSNLAKTQAVFTSAGNDGLLVAYYTLTLKSASDMNIKVVTIENRTGEDTKGHTRYYESALTSGEGMSLKLDTPIADIKAVDGNTYAIKSISLENESNAVTVEGMEGLSVICNEGAVDDFDFRKAGKKFSINKKQSQGDACDEIWNETGEENKVAGIDVPSMFMDDAYRSQTPLVIWYDGFNLIAYPSYESGADISMNGEDKDRILFQDVSKGGVKLTGSYNPADVTPNFPNLLDTWFNEQGLFVVRQENGRNAKGEEKFCIYLLCPDISATLQGGMWIKLQRQ